MGASVGHALLGFPLSTVLGLGLGGGLMAAGVSYDALRTLACAPKGQKWKCIKDVMLEKHFHYIPEAFLTGLVSGVIAGAIQKQMAVTTEAEGEYFIRDYLGKNYTWGACRATFFQFDPKHHRMIVGWGPYAPDPWPADTWTSVVKTGWGPPYGRGYCTLYFSGIPLPVKVVQDLSMPAHAATQTITLNRAAMA